jgi:hypothetical protein
MNKVVLATFLLLTLPVISRSVDLVKDGKPVAEIVISESANPGVKTAANELQSNLEKISGAKLPIVSKVSPDVKNQVYVGESDYTGKLGVKLDDVKYDGFKIIADKNYVVLAGKEIQNEKNSFSKFKDVASKERQKVWEEYTGHKWRFPPIIDHQDGNKECGFHLGDGTGTLYAVYELLQQLGFRWYMPVMELGIVIPQSKNITINDQNFKREPEFSQRMSSDPRIGRNKDEFLWYKSMGVGTSRVMPVYHSLSGPLLHRSTKDRNDQPDEYFGVVNGKIDYNIPKLTSEKLRADFLKYIEFVDKAFPGIEYACIGQPDGWSNMDSADAAAGWDKQAERGQFGRFSNYTWDFILDIRKRYMQKYPDKKFTVFAYAYTHRPPTNIDKIPENITVGFCQTSQFWMLPNEELRDRDEWLKKLSNKDQLIIWEYYLQHAPMRNFPPAPVIFTKLMQQNFKGLYDHCAGFTLEVAWATPKERELNNLGTRYPGLSHLMLYLHNRLCWDRNLDLQAVLDEYYKLFFGPAAAEMKEFYEFAESVWMRPEPRQITAAGGFMKQADVDKYFDILSRAKAKAGDTIYGKRIDLIVAEMAPLKILFDNLKRNGPQIQAFVADEQPKIDGDLNKPFWQAMNNSKYSFHKLRDMITGKDPKHVSTSVSFRWLPDNSALIIGIECMEPKMDKLRENCKIRDSAGIYSDDFVEVRLETPQGIRPKIVVNPAGAVLDECIFAKVGDLPEFYTVKDVAVKKYPDRWSVEMKIDAKTLAGERPTKTYPWGVNICRQRLTEEKPEFYMLSPSGTNFKDMKSMGNLFLRK